MLQNNTRSRNAQNTVASMAVQFKNHHRCKNARVNERSESQFNALHTCLYYTSIPRVYITGDGYYQLVWSDGTGSALCLHFLGGQIMHYTVFGPGQKFGLPDILERGYCHLEELHEVIETNRIERLLGYK